MSTEFTDADHERALRAGQYASARNAGEKPVTARRGKPVAASREKKVRFAALGVRVQGAAVCKDEWQGKRLGSIAGAHAELTDGTRPHRVGAALITAPLSLGAGLLIGLTRGTRASAFVVFADGTLHERKLSGKSQVAAAQRDVIKFNALAAAQQPV